MKQVKVHFRLRLGEPRLTDWTYVFTQFKVRIFNVDVFPSDINKHWTDSDVLLAETSRSTTERQSRRVRATEKYIFYLDIKFTRVRFKSTAIRKRVSSFRRTKQCIFQFNVTKHLTEIFFSR